MFLTDTPTGANSLSGVKSMIRAACLVNIIQPVKWDIHECRILSSFNECRICHTKEWICKTQQNQSSEKMVPKTTNLRIAQSTLYNILALVSRPRSLIDICIFNQKVIACRYS